MSTEATGENQQQPGGLSQLKDSMMGKVDWVLSRPDKYRALRYVYDIALIGIGIAILCVTTGNFDPASLSNPTVGVIMAMPMSFAITGIGVAWLLEDVIGKKHQRTAAKIMAFIMPLALIAGTVCLMGAGLHGGFKPFSINNYFLAGLLLLPLSLFALDRSAKILTHKEPIFVRRASDSVEKKEYHRLQAHVTNTDRDLPPNTLVDENL